ncbi:hypothetical protein NESM_000170400 [Novymonas esmeraldas]|uniref:Uncharacterized protein n=1 Tax=Novymonas esmeraldas TaxID=1808958 RepID=A0AAW0F3I0_9TRYP
MRVFVLVAVGYGDGCTTSYPPSVWHLQRCVREHSRSCFHATSGAYIWTHDALFQALQRRRLQYTDAAVRGASAPPAAEAAKAGTKAGAVPTQLAFFSALLDVGDNEEDVGVVAMLLSALCSTWQGTVAAHMEVCRSTHRGLLRGPHSCTSSSTVGAEGGHGADPRRVDVLEREETLLVWLAGEIEADPVSQDTFLRRWGVREAWDYAAALRGRSWWVSGGAVALLPTTVAASVVQTALSHLVSAEAGPCRESDPHPSPPPHQQEGKDTASDDWSTALVEALAHAVLERRLTHAFATYLRDEVVPRVATHALHRLTVAVPPTVALFLRSTPTPMLQRCLLHHTVDCPLVPIDGTGASPVVTPTASSNAFVLHDSAGAPPAALLQEQNRVAGEETARVAELFGEYDELLAHDAAVRLPLSPVSRYTLTQLLCQSELPSALMIPFMRRHSTFALERRGYRGDEACAPTEEEVVLGMRVTWAVGRWTAALRRRAAVAGGAAPRRLPLWSGDDRDGEGGVLEWVQQRMRDARQAAEALGTARHAEADVVTEDCVSAQGVADPLQRRRHAALVKLEERLFAPFPTTYRGSSTAWLAEAMRDAGEELTRAAVGVHSQDGDAAALVAEPTAGSSRLGDTSDEGDDRSASDDSGHSAESLDASDGEEEEEEGEEEGEGSSLLKQLAELEAALHRERAATAGGREQQMAGTAALKAADGPVESSDDHDAVAPWLTAADMQHISRNDLFLHHVRLLESEMTSTRKRT